MKRDWKEFCISFVIGVVLSLLVMFILSGIISIATEGLAKASNPYNYTPPRQAITTEVAKQIDRVATRTAAVVNLPSSAQYDQTHTYEQMGILQIGGLPFELYKVDTTHYRLQSFTWGTQACITLSGKVGVYGTVKVGSC